LVFAKYILLPQKTSANFRAPFIGISVISFCAVVPIKAAALLFYSSCTDKAIQDFLDVTEHDSVSINMAIDSVS
jgi:hypothetical protein